MTMFKNNRIIKLQALAEIAGINVWKIYNRLKVGEGRTKSTMDPNDKTKLVNALSKELVPLFNDLGFDIKITRRKETEGKLSA